MFNIHLSFFVSDKTISDFSLSVKVLEISNILYRRGKSACGEVKC